MTDQISPSDDERLRKIEENRRHAEAARALFRPDPFEVEDGDDGKDEDEKTIYELDKLTDIDHPQYAGKIVKVRAVVASNSVSYIVPKALRVECTAQKKHSCQKEANISLQPSEIARYPDSKNRDQLNEDNAKRAFSKKCWLTWEEKTDTLYRIRVRPFVMSLIFQNGKTVDESGGEYKAYDIYAIVKTIPLEPGSVYQITGIVIPDPRSQKVTLFVTRLTRDSGSEYDLERIQAVAAVLRSKETVADRVRWIVENFQRFSKVRKREDVILANFLTFFSPLSIMFDGKRERGYVIGEVIGDSTTGKSEVTKGWIRLLNGGQLVVAETASMVGLSATTTQAGNGSWFVEWGPLVLGDRRLLAIDGAQKLTRQEWSTLAEAQRLGTIKITKAARGEAHARTRQLLIANPVDFERRSTKEMDGFLYPYLALPSVLDAVNIARLDIAVFVNSHDVKIEDLNTPLDGNYDEELQCLSDLRAFVWDGKYEVKYSEDFDEEIHAQANTLYNKYHVSSVPLVSIDMKYKLVRLSTALALGTCSFDDDFTVVKVTEEHVQYIANLLNELYDKAAFDEGSEKDKAGQVDQAKLAGILADMTDRLKFDEKKSKEMLKWIGQQAAGFSKAQIKAKFNLSDKSELQPLLAFLRDEELIARGSGFYPTSKAVQLAKLLINA